MFRFSIRDLLWLTAFVALSVGWAIDHWRPNNKFLKAELKNVTMEQALKSLGYEVEQEWWKVRVRSKTDPKFELIAGSIDPPDSP